MNLTVDSTFQPNDIWPLHSLLTPLSMLNPLTWRMNDLYNSFTILCLIYVFDEIEMSLNHSSRKESWCESTSITPYHTVYRDMCTISVFVTQRSPLGCAGLFDLTKTRFTKVPHISTVMTCSWPCSLLFFSLFLPSVYYTTSFSFPFSHQFSGSVLHPDPTFIVFFL